MVHADADDATTAPLLPGLGDPVEQAVDGRHGRRALWISIAALVVLAAAAWPVAGHLLRSAPERVRTPETLAGLALDRNADATATADYLRGAIAAGMGLEQSVGAVYTDGGGNAHSVTVIVIGGSTGSGSEASRLAALFGLLDGGTHGFTQVTAEPAGQLGGLVRCALSTEPARNGTATTDPRVADEFAVCGWADGSTIGVALFPDRTVDQAGALFGRIRAGLLGRA
jgi:hypothetical protein